LYRGGAVYCTVCENSFSKFQQLPEDLLCPKCGSLGRQRQLWQILEKKNLICDKSVLHLSPARSLRRKIEIAEGIEYHTSDYNGDWKTDFKYDITNILAPPNRYDTIICYHILEHIRDDRKAMRELHRMVRPGGVVLVQTPFKEGNIYENEAKIHTPADRLAHFEQEDHLRIYSVEGLANRLRESGFTVQIMTFDNEYEAVYKGLKSPEYVLWCEK
ncbi:MAG: hypothetical protein RI894_1341, partial [Bacteroidota bacterium]